MNSNPLVSIIIPHYNQSQYLADCLESVLTQTFTEWEAIIVDDSSTDGDAETLVKKFTDPRFYFVKHSTNRGQGAARNTGFRQARGSFVLPLDADDCLAPDFLEQTVDILEAHCDIDCVFADIELFGAERQIWIYSIRSVADMLTTQWIPGAGTLMRRALWEKIGGYCEEFDLRGNEDWDFWIGAMRLNAKAFHLSQALYRYRKHPTSITSKTLRYNDYLTREIIYRRHRTFFDVYRAGNTFRATGYLTSSRMVLSNGEHMRALKLGIQGWLLAPLRPDLLHQILLTIFPTSLRAILRHMKPI